MLLLSLLSVECSFLGGCYIDQSRYPNKIVCPSERWCILKKCNVGLIIESMVGDSCRCRIDECSFVELDTCESINISKSKYINSTMMIIRNFVKEMTHERKCHIERILSYIYNEIGGNKNTLALFTSSALHNTSYLSIIRAESKDKYCSRGLLMIKELIHYRVLTYLSDIDFVSFPEKLEEQNCSVVKATVYFFKWIMRKSKYTFINMMQALNPDEYRIYIDSNCTIKNERWQNRERLYNMMMRVY